MTRRRLRRPPQRPQHHRRSHPQSHPRSRRRKPPPRPRRRLPRRAPAARRSRSRVSAAWGPGQKATGDPIKLGGIATNVPGIDFTWITGMAKAYFDCVNDNGGINGRPIQYIAETEQVDPQQIAALATKLVEQDKVLGLVGNTSIIDCSVNKDYYAKQGFYLIIAGVDQACFTSPNYSAVNMGPYYSSLGGAQAAVRAGAKGKLVIVGPNQPGFDLINSGVVDFAKQNGMEGISLSEDVPINDPAGLAQKLVQDAGDGGGVVLDFTGPRSCRSCRPSSSRASSTRSCGPAPPRRTTRRWPRSSARRGTASSSSTPSSTCSTRASPTRTT